MEKQEGIGGTVQDKGRQVKQKALLSCGFWISNKGHVVFYFQLKLRAGIFMCSLASLVKY